MNCLKHKLPMRKVDLGGTHIAANCENSEDSKICSQTTGRGGMSGLCLECERGCWLCANCTRNLEAENA